MGGSIRQRPHPLHLFQLRLLSIISGLSPPDQEPSRYKRRSLLNNTLFCCEEDVKSPHGFRSQEWIDLRIYLFKNRKYTFTWFVEWYWMKTLPHIIVLTGDKHIWHWKSFDRKSRQKDRLIRYLIWLWQTRGVPMAVNLFDRHWTQREVAFMNGTRSLCVDGDRKPSMSVLRSKVQTHLKTQTLAKTEWDSQSQPWMDPSQETGSNKQQNPPFINILCG